MKHFPVVESVMSQVKLPESRLENYFNKTHLNDKGLSDRFSSDFENIACKSIHTKAKGSVQLVLSSGISVMSLDIPVSAHFLVTGTKTYRQRCKLAFAASLS